MQNLLSYHLRSVLTGWQTDLDVNFGGLDVAFPTTYGDLQTFSRTIRVGFKSIVFKGSAGKIDSPCDVVSTLQIVGFFADVSTLSLVEPFDTSLLVGVNAPRSFEPDRKFDGEKSLNVENENENEIEIADKSEDVKIVKDIEHNFTDSAGTADSLHSSGSDPVLLSPAHWEYSARRISNLPSNALAISIGVSPLTSHISEGVLYELGSWLKMNVPLLLPISSCEYNETSVSPLMVNSPCNNTDKYVKYKERVQSISDYIDFSAEITAVFHELKISLDADLPAPQQLNVNTRSASGKSFGSKKENHGINAEMGTSSSKIPVHPLYMISVRMLQWVAVVAVSQCIPGVDLDFDPPISTTMSLGSVNFIRVRAAPTEAKRLVCAVPTSSHKPNTNTNTNTSSNSNDSSSTTARSQPAKSNLEDPLEGDIKSSSNVIGNLQHETENEENVFLLQIRMYSDLQLNINVDVSDFQFVVLPEVISTVATLVNLYEQAVLDSIVYSKEFAGPSLYATKASTEFFKRTQSDSLYYRGVKEAVHAHPASTPLSTASSYAPMALEKGNSTTSSSSSSSSSSFSFSTEGGSGQSAYGVPKNSSTAPKNSVLLTKQSFALPAVFSQINVKLSVVSVGRFHS